VNQRDHTSLDSIALLRLPEVLKIVPVSPSSWWAGVKSGRFPQSVKLGPRTTCWRASDIIALIERSAGKSRELAANRNSEAENSS
jgi:predicted DNA-binding transcriptional regulator AlpA